MLSQLEREAGRLAQSGDQEGEVRGAWLDIIGVVERHLGVNAEPLRPSRMSRLRSAFELRA